MLQKILRTASLLTVALLFSCTATKTALSDAPPENLIIYYEPEAGNGKLLEAAEKYGSKVIYVYKNINGIAVTVPRGRTAADAMKYYRGIKGVLSVTKDRKMQLD